MIATFKQPAHNPFDLIKAFIDMSGDINIVVEDSERKKVALCFSNNRTYVRSFKLSDILRWEHTVLPSGTTITITI